jgi:hypothetical protein
MKNFNDDAESATVVSLLVLGTATIFVLLVYVIWEWVKKGF